MRKAPNLRLASWSFIIYDDEFKKPTWRVVLKNWPLINYLKSKEESWTIEAAVDATSGRLLGLKEYQ